MRLDTKPGESVYFLGRNGYDFQLAAAKKVFKPGLQYTVSSIEVGCSSSTVSFVGDEDRKWNTVMFANIDTYIESAMNAEPEEVEPEKTPMHSLILDVWKARAEYVNSAYQTSCMKDRLKEKVEALTKAADEL